MVQALINIDDHANRILNIIKAKFDLRDKSKAIELIATQYEEHLLEPELRPLYVEKAKRIMKERPIHVGTVAQLRKRYE